ncbi:synaptic vesicle glycoprotein 2C-like isoform X2 [Drosophila sulfurigaster albostrigata]|uniref:synaptic vesicle glycoprotein 2C-like isoform X2 n=1 Tax=Drosophila sulfurigaster albostrigata TaxID=89887 RepID=UPI002D21B194|nr:synaptic vesicle glycoprotein 2C-like isoform X2 [Drosophila sulfurigaster albostrigata]
MADKSDENSTIHNISDIETDTNGHSNSTVEASVGSPANAPADFDKAIDASGFGRFNLILFFLAIFATCANMFESTTMSYILPIAECDLHLTLTDKGVLNACAYAGMIISAIPWGYLSDTKGRRKVLVYGYLLTSICVFGSALSQNFIMLVTFKFLGGLMVNGPAAVLFTYLTELHGPKYRSNVLMVVGMVTSGCLLLLPVLAWAIFPRDWDFVLFESLAIHSWQIFLFVCALPSLISGFVLWTMPESPKFLMSQGRNAEALQMLQKIYRINTGKPKDTYPIKSLVLEVPSRDAQKDEAIYTIDDKSESKTEPVKRESRTVLESLRAGMQQMKPMFHKPLLGLALQIYTMQFAMFLGLNTIRLWLPQLFSSMADFEAEFDESAEMCTILEYSINKTAETLTNHENACAEPKVVSMDMYINNIIVSACGLVGYFFAGSIIRLVGTKRLLTYGLFISSILGLALYWSVNSLMTLCLASAFLTVAGVSFSSLLSAVVSLFPTQLRSIVVAITMMCGRLGALSGNLLFPVFIQIGCLPPFVMVSAVMIIAGVLSIFVPNPKKATFT